MPLRKNIGRNTTQMARVETKAGDRDLLGAVEDRRHQRLAHVQVAVDVLHLDGRIVDQDADRERETAEGHDVDRLVQRAEDQDRRQDRQRDGDGDDQRAAPAADEEPDHQGGQAGGDQRFAQHRGDGRAHEHRLVGQRLGDQLRRKDLRGAWQDPSDAGHHVEGARRCHFEDAHQRETPRRCSSCRTMLVCGAKPSLTCATSLT